MSVGPDTVHALAGFLAVTMRCATPILFAAIGVMLMARCGVINIGAEGMMLVGAFAAVVGSYYMGSAWAGMLAAAFASGLLGLIFAFCTVTLRANQMVAGTAINILAMGLTSSFDRVIFGVNVTPPQIAAFRVLKVPVLAKLPIIGEAVFSQAPPVYLVLLVIPLVHFLLYRTSVGLVIRSTGENPKAVDTVGINVQKVKYATVITGAVLTGLGGGYLSLGLLSFFAENMTAGRGFIALAAVIFGRFTPFGALGAALLFGAGNALQFQLQAAGSTVNQEFFLMVPYVLTLAAICGFVGKSAAPAHLGRPYSKE